jgi:hypothetical protein
MEQNFIINFANELMNHLYSDISNTIQEDICYNALTNQLIDISSTHYAMYRPILITYLNEDTSHNNTLYSSSASSSSSYPYQASSRSSSSYLRNNIYNNTIYDSSYITLASQRNNYYNNLNFSRAINLREILRSLYTNYYEEDENNTFLETFINSTFENKAKFKKVISTSELEKLKPQKFNKINESTTNIQCPILCYNFEEDEEIIKLPCNHNYNCEAIIKWLSQESNTCPVCRYEFDYKEINIDNKRQTLEQTQTQTQDQEDQQYQEDQEDQQYQEDQEDQQYQEDQEDQQYQDETTNYYNLFSSEDILMQEILLNSYSINNH